MTRDNRTVTGHRAQPPLVRLIHAYHLTGLQPGIHIGVPGAALVWVIDLDGSYRLEAAGTSGVQRFSSSVSGLSTQHAAIHHTAVQSGVYVELSPTLSRTMFGVAAHELADETVELDQLWGAAAGRLMDRLHSASLTQRESVVHAAIRDRVAEVNATTAAPCLWRQAVERRLTPSQLARESGWSARHLRRLTLKETGVTPAVLSRLARFERSVRDVRSKGLSLASAAVTNGYADQAQLCRDWRSLLGMTPTEFLRREGLSESAVQGP